MPDVHKICTSVTGFLPNSVGVVFKKIEKGYEMIFLNNLMILGPVIKNCVNFFGKYKDKSRNHMV